MKGILNDDGVWVDKEEDIMAVVTTYFKNIYSTSQSKEEAIERVSKNVGQALGDKCRDILGVSITSSLGSYLGMPSLNCKNKNRLFSKIKGSVWKALKPGRGSCFP